ncbi:MAG: hypothetical protein JXA41_12035 [Deltaproteobacteria bacterium]|nr:hypothetical protein [Deltaproteobacteria bacterium]
MKKIFVIGVSILAGFLFLLSVPQAATAFEAGARAYIWFPTFSGDLKIDGATVPGTKISGGDDLGLGHETYPAAEIFGGIGKHHLSLGYMSMEHSGISTLSRNITFNGTTFASGVALNTDLKFKMLDLEYQYDLVDLENILAGFSLGLIGKIKYLCGEAELRAPALSLTASETLKVPIPMIGVGLHVGILANLLEARAKLTGAGYDGDNLIYEAEADLSLTPFPFMNIHGGYKIINIQVDRNSVFIDSEFSGPYVALTIAF